jgi:hypothetical protein
VTNELLIKLGKAVLKVRALKKAHTLSLKTSQGEMVNPFATDTALSNYNEAIEELHVVRNEVYRAATAAAQQEEKNAQLN